MPVRQRIELSETQTAFVTGDRKYELFLGGIGAGKTHAGAIKAIGAIRAGGLGMVIAPTFRMLRDSTWRTAISVWRDLGIVEQILRGDELRVVFRNGAEAIFRSAEDPDRLRGPNASWAWIDEAAQCHPDTWLIAIGRLREAGRAGRCWLTTTPKGMNWLYEVFVRRATDETMIYKAPTWSNPFNPPEYAASLAEQYEGDFALQELEAEFIADDESALLRYEWLEQAGMMEAAYVRGEPITAGVDVAGPGEDETVLVVRQGSGILGVQGWGSADARGDVLHALRPFASRGLESVCVDGAGIGHYFAEHLRDNLPPEVTVRSINVGESPTTDKGKEKYRNLKAELYWSFRERCAEGDLAGLTDRLAISQLAGIRYSHDSRGRIEIESKEDARKRGVKSPDRAEAIVLAFAPPDPKAVRTDAYAKALGARAKVA